jgi:DNA-directed RNA polymerase specialized sigma24 family protein
MRLVMNDTNALITQYFELEKSHPRQNEQIVLKTIYKYLCKFHLNNTFEPREIFNETYIRAIKHLELGKEIPNITAWFRSTSYNIVREYSRKEKRQLEICSKYEFNFSQYSLSSSKEFIHLFDALKKLKPIDRELLISHATGISWEQIAKNLINRGDEEGDIKTVANKLAKRHSRLRKKLRDGEN